jgi:hypothetical protein
LSSRWNMLEPGAEHKTDTFLAELSPLAQQGARILAHLSEFPESLGNTDIALSSRVGEVSAEHVAIVRRSLLKAGLAVQSDFTTNLSSPSSILSGLAENLKGIAAYLQVHVDRNSVRLVLTEPGENSVLRREIDRKHGLSSAVFQTSDVFFSLARRAARDLIVLAPFIDNQGADFLVELFSLCRPEVRRHLVCRPLDEPHCGNAFHLRAGDFRRLGVLVYEYALPSSLPSRRETFHAKVVLADDSMFYVGSSNFMGSALERTFECGVVVEGQVAKELHSVLEAMRSIATRVQTY